MARIEACDAQRSHRTHVVSPRSLLRSLEMATLMLCIVLGALQGALGGEQTYRNDGLIDRLSNGMKFAQDFLGTESIALKVAEFVVRAFKPKTDAHTTKPSFNDLDESSDRVENVAQGNQPNAAIHEAQSPMTPLKQLVRLFGLQPTQISAVAVNALVFVAQMISTFLAGPKRSNKPQRYGDTKAWIINKNSRKLQELIATAKNESLSDMIEDLIRDEVSDDDTSCIRLLVCKLSPFVSRMQKAVFGEDDDYSGEWKKLRGSAMMYRHLPSSDEIKDRSDLCEQKYNTCDLNETSG